MQSINKNFLSIPPPQSLQVVYLLHRLRANVHHPRYRNNKPTPWPNRPTLLHHRWWKLCPDNGKKLFLHGGFDESGCRTSAWFFQTETVWTFQWKTFCRSYRGDIQWCTTQYSRGAQCNIWSEISQGRIWTLQSYMQTQRCAM